MNNSWDVKPRSARGDSAPNPLYLAVGAALTQWEYLESAMAELFDCLVSGAARHLSSNRSGHAVFGAVSSSSVKTGMITAAIPRALKGSNNLACAEAVLMQIKEYGARRNEFAHGIVFDLGDHGFYLCPNNTNPHKWHQKGTKIGEARYQYIAEDVAYYAEKFMLLRLECETLIEAIQHERIATVTVTE